MLFIAGVGLVPVLEEVVVVVVGVVVVVVVVVVPDDGPQGFGNG
jgi:hypothetical protein